MPNKLDLISVGTPSMDILHAKNGVKGRFGGSVAYLPEYLQRLVSQTEQ